MDSDALVLCKTEGILSREWVYEIPRFGVYEANLRHVLYNTFFQLPSIVIQNINGDSVCVNNALLLYLELSPP